MDSEEVCSEEKIEEGEEPRGPLVPLSEAAAVFIRATFGTKVDNTTRVAKAKGRDIPDSQWIRYPKLDPVVLANVSAGARLADRAASRIQHFWLDAVNPLVIILEKAEELELPAEEIHSIQIALRLMGNANSYQSITCRNALTNNAAESPAEITVQ